MVVFTCGAVPEPNGTVKIYWGGADTVICLSQLQVVEVAPDRPDLEVLGLLKCHAYFAGLPLSRHSP